MRSPLVFAWRALENAQFDVGGLKVRSLGVENAQTPWRTLPFTWRTLDFTDFQMGIVCILQFSQGLLDPVSVTA